MINYDKTVADRSIKTIDELLTYSYKLVDSEYQNNRNIYLEKLSKLIKYMDRSIIANHEFWMPHPGLDNETLCLKWTLIKLSESSIRDVARLGKHAFNDVSSFKPYSHTYNKVIINSYEAHLFFEFNEVFNNMMKNHKDIINLYANVNDIGRRLAKHHSINSYTSDYNI